MVISFRAYHVILDKPPIQQWLSYLHKIEQLGNSSRFKRKVAVPTIFQGHSGIVKVLGEELQFVVMLDYFQNTFSKCEEFSLHPGYSSC